MQTAHAIIPVARLSRAKSRLSVYLDADQRASLVLAMLHDVASALKRSPRIESVLVVTPDSKVTSFAEGLGLETTEDPHRADMNRAIRHATRYIIEKSGDVPVILFPVDVPLVRTSTVTRIVENLDEYKDRLVVACPSSNNGTNALLRNPPECIEPSFGPRSFEFHKGQADLAGIKFISFESPDLSIDIDDIRDLRLIANERKDLSTTEVIHQIGSI